MQINKKNINMFIYIKGSNEIIHINSRKNTDMGIGNQFQKWYQLEIHYNVKIVQDTG